MSQSDYIRFKKTATKLALDNSESPVFNVGDYIDFKQFSLENSITNTSPTYNYIVPSNRRVIFKMDKVVSSCPTFATCKNTNTRPNRIRMSASYFTPTPQPLNWKLTNIANNGRFLDCECNTSLYKS